MFQLNCELAQLLNLLTQLLKSWRDENHLLDEFTVSFCIINSVADDILQWEDDYNYKWKGVYVHYRLTNQPLYQKKEITPHLYVWSVILLVCVNIIKVWRCFLNRYVINEGSFISRFKKSQEQEFITMHNPYFELLLYYIYIHRVTQRINTKQCYFVLPRECTWVRAGKINSFVKYQMFCWTVWAENSLTCCDNDQHVHPCTCTLCCSSISRVSWQYLI